MKITTGPLSKLSARAAGIVLRAGFDLTNIEVAKQQVLDAMALGRRFWNCGEKTRAELIQWASTQDISSLELRNTLVTKGAIAHLESMGYIVVPPKNTVTVSC